MPNHTAQLPQEKKPSRTPLRGSFVLRVTSSNLKLAKIANMENKCAKRNKMFKILMWDIMDYIGFSKYPGIQR